MQWAHTCRMGLSACTGQAKSNDDRSGNDEAKMTAQKYSERGRQ
jgi:hypothetical protein